jgi:predicted PurR-regulated permease PerM
MATSDRAQRVASISQALIAISLIIALLYFGRAFFITLITGVVISFILDPLVCFFIRFRVPRGAASFLACTLALLVLYLAGLGVTNQAVGLWEELPEYSSRVTALVDATSGQIESVEKSLRDSIVPKRLRDARAAQQPEKAPRKKRQPEPPAPAPVQEVRIREEGSPLVNYVYSSLQHFYTPLLMASFLPFLVYFMLSWRDHVRTAFLNIVPDARRPAMHQAWQGVGEVARAYVVGNFLLGVLLASASAMLFYFLRLPHWQLSGPASGFLSLIPYIGLPLAVLPPLFDALTVYTGVGAYLMLGTLVAVMHLFALNLLYPKVVGARVHLNPLTVTVALMFWYLLWGAPGLVLAIPITAGMKAVFDSVPGLSGYGRLLGD